MSDFYRRLIEILRAHGCRPVRNEISPVNGRHVTVPRFTKSRHTANDVLKQAGLEKQF